ncbi:MAG: alpha/beta hydrolase [Cyanobacteria bacterium P01_G01_bin.38]
MFRTCSINSLLTQGLLLLALPLVACTAETGAIRSVELELASESIQVETDTGALQGTLLLSPDPEPHPVVLIVAGSGPTDRDGNSALLPGKNNSLKLLAEALAEQGIASVRYDKRGIAESANVESSEAELRFETYADDATEWIQKLKADRRFTSVTVLGHSEGSLVGMLAVQRSDADSFISIAGGANRASDLLREQARNQLPSELQAESEQILAALESGQTTNEVSEELFSLYRPSVQPYLISLFKYVPVQEIEKLNVPTMIVQGTTDIQVGVTEAQALGQAKPEAEVRIIKGMNHVLKSVPEDLAQQQSSYTDPSLPIEAKLVEEIVRFVKG